MAKSLSVLKRQRQNEKRRIRNRAANSRVKTFVRYARESIAAGDAAQAEQKVKQAIRELDKAQEHGILHRNTVARKKSRLVKKLLAIKQVGQSEQQNL